ncbi:hypothetical protein MIH18_12815 [Marinobacter sp. M3C]|uniref:hypothetical protein n=1 Tax=unclassified Marinobacter TaxID=83889 RepID=UPI00201090F4|nr:MULTISPECIES: hypothetical protein [unclassified Marinobacter]MCL1479803.1 hypothetical protein [Marinobacter sp.]MCL1488058.1 hypothetical protein [Marinobacter sp.]UQG56018.1 hypothetical protein MIH16_21945 [Marinobacter sp. M4C]UQG58645.1 hypothetical protein MIH18_12815 [Marinobacter sp. M3C]UQG64823.1 hypothetical protein MIH17_21945 [Marinobacter sp. M2C]
MREAYGKKWWTFPSFLDNGFGPAIEKLYKDYLPLRILDHPDRPSGSYVTTREGADRLDAALSRIKTEIQENWARLERDILTEAIALWQPCIDCLRNGERQPDYTLLAPLNHQASVSPQMAKDYVLRFGSAHTPPRTPLGNKGLLESSSLQHWADRVLAAMA